MVTRSHLAYLQQALRDTQVCVGRIAACRALTVTQGSATMSHTAHSVRLASPCESPFVRISPNKNHMFRSNLGHSTSSAYHVPSMYRDPLSTPPQAALDHECVKRKADRVGRIRAEQELRSIKVHLQRLQLQLQLQPQSDSHIVTAVADASGACPEDGRHDCHGEGLEATKRPSFEEESWGASQRKIDEEEERRDQQQQRLPEEEVKDQGARRRHRGQQQQQHGGFAGRAKGSAPEHQSASIVSGDGLEAKRAATAATAALAAAGSTMPAFPFRPIGHLQSVFTER